MGKEFKNDPKIDSMEKEEGLSRRKFLASTGGAGAALAVAATGLLNGCDSSRTSDTSAEQAIKAGATKTAQPLKYSHLLAPMKIGNHILKNRMIGTPISPHLLPGPESYPNEAIIYYYANKARAGAALVVLSQAIETHPEYELDALKYRLTEPNEVNPNKGSPGGHTPIWDLANTGNQNILSQLTEAVHLYNSLCLWKPKINAPAGYDASSGNAPERVPGFGAVSAAPNFAVGVGPSMSAESKEITVEMLQKITEDVAFRATMAQECGFDGMHLHCSYRAPLPARMMSPLTNHRTDKYGGSLENRIRFAIEIADAVKKRCGDDFFILASMSGCEYPEGGYSLDDGAEFAKLFTGHIDLLDVKGDPNDRSHPSNFVPGRTPFLYMTEHYKKKGVTIPLVSDGGFTNLDWAEEAIASNKTDCVGVARMTVTTPEFGRLAYEGRNEDVVPCLRCNACAGKGDTSHSVSPWNSVCPVNPVWGLEHKLDKIFSPPTDKKKVAVIGGGPAGMEAALVAAQRGHTVTLYEKTDGLGGIFRKFDNVPFKWTHKDFKDYMVRQIAKSGVKVRLNTEADPAMIKKEGYEAVIVAIGGEPIVPDIPGSRGKNVILVTDVFGREDSLAKDVVIIGGERAGTETGMHLVQKGHRVTVLEESKVLAPDARAAHFVFNEVWEDMPDFKPILQARCNGISEDGVTYVDASGKQQSVKAGSVVLALGTKAKADLAFKFHESTNLLYVVGDCAGGIDLQTAMRSAWSAASTL